MPQCDMRRQKGRMLFREAGNRELPTIILLHGGGVSWWSLQPIVELLKDSYHVVTPVIDGHGEDGDTTFISIEDSADKLLGYIDSQCGGSVFALGGLSLGGQIATEVLSQRHDVARFAILESALVIPMKGTVAWTVPLTKMSYGLIKQRWFSKLQAKSLFVSEDMFELYYRDSMRVTERSLINITVSNGNYELKSGIGKTAAKALIIAGEKELAIVRKSSQLLSDTIPHSNLHIAKGMKHGELSQANPGEYVGLLRALFES